MTRVGAGGTRRGRPGSRWDRWLGSWRFAFRLGSREVRRHPGRSALIMALVATPVLLITAFLTFFMSQDISVEEGIDRELGASAAAVLPAHGPVGWVMNVGQATDPTDGKLTPGYDADDPWDAARVADTVGSPVVPVGHVGVRPEGEASHAVEARNPLNALVLDGAPDGSTQPLATLRSGRWAQVEGEVVVTPAGVARGLPDSGPVALVLGTDAEATTLRVVGVADAAYSSNGNAELLLPAAAAPAATSWQWLVERTEPVRLAEAQEWALHGLDVTSRELQLNPPPDQDWRDENATNIALFYGMIGLAILVETVLLAGPAFAVSAARQRHSLALAGAQGASRADVRRAIVAYGLVLAVVATLGAALLGAILGLGGAMVLAQLRPSQHVQLELPWRWILPLVLASIVAAGVAAWWPARGATRLDIMSVLRGQVVSGRVGGGWPLVGAILALAGGGALLHAATSDPHRAPPWMIGGAALLGLGVMALVPAILALVSRLSARAPLTWRLAARDAMRQRSRAVPAVLAIVAAVAVMAATATVQVSSTANRERQYTAQVPEGTMSVTAGVQGDPTSTEAATTLVVDAVADLLPGATAYPLSLIQSGPGMDEMGEPTDAPYRSVVPADCTVEELTTRFENDTGEAPHCYLEDHDTYAVAPVAALERTGGLTPQMREVLGAGGLIAWDRGSLETGDAARGRVEAQLASAPARATGQEGGTELTGPATLDPVVVYWASATEMDELRVSRQNYAGGYVTPETAERLDWDGVPAGVFVAADDPFSLGEAVAIEEAVGRDSYVYLERGFVPSSEDRLMPLVILGVFSLIALAAVVISTALAISEGQRDSATMAAVGATQQTRRFLAAMHAVLVGAVGVLVGLGLGLAVGGVMSWTTTSVNSFGTSYAGYPLDGGVVAVPWVWLGTAAVAVPLIAAAVAWLSVRRAPVLTRAIT